jgi:hypothetical protein
METTTWTALTLRLNRLDKPPSSPSGVTDGRGSCAVLYFGSAISALAWTRRTVTSSTPCYRGNVLGSLWDRKLSTVTAPIAPARAWTAPLERSGGAAARPDDAVTSLPGGVAHLAPLGGLLLACCHGGRCLKPLPLNPLRRLRKTPSNDFSRVRAAFVARRSWDGSPQGLARRAASYDGMRVTLLLTAA